MKLQTYYPLGVICITGASKMKDHMMFTNSLYIVDTIPV